MDLTHLEQAIDEVKKLHGNVKKYKTRQITSQAEQSLIKATVSAWFYTHAKDLAIANSDTSRVTALYNDLLEISDKHATRKHCLCTLKELKQSLITFRSKLLATPPPSNPIEQPPDFSVLISDLRMQGILFNRWVETQKCVSGEIPLAAMVMMGGLLEGIFLAKIQTLPDDTKKKVFTSIHAPKDTHTGKILPLKDWRLNSFIEVLQGVGLITKPAKNVSGIIRDYRNYIHPEREYSSGEEIARPSDAVIYWSIFNAIIKQLLEI
jgi:hypothetical protein